MLVLHSLGIEPDPEYCGQLPIDTFLKVCRGWLRRNIGNPSLEIETIVEGNFIDCGIGAGYINRRVHELSVLAHKGREAGATDMVWS
jgi:hypothetical protein